MNGEQLAAGRALIRLSQKELAERTGVSLPTLRRMEACIGDIKGTFTNVTAIKTALENAGVEFIPENGGGAGVRLKKVGTSIN